MNIPGYDAWKLASPPEPREYARPSGAFAPCVVCGAGVWCDEPWVTALHPECEPRLPGSDDCAACAAEDLRVVSTRAAECCAECIRLWDETRAEPVEYGDDEDTDDRWEDR